MKKIIPLKLIIVTLLLLSNCNFSFGQWNYDIDSITFETFSPALLPIDDSSSWQVGHPEKSNFQSAHSSAKAIVTDTLFPYPKNDSSTFTIAFPMWNRVPNIFMNFSFWQKYDMDTLNDRGIVEISYNDNDWYEMSSYSHVSSYDYEKMSIGSWNSGDTKDGKLNVTGKSNGWEKAEYEWYLCFAVRQEDTGSFNTYYLDTLRFRFTFLSDSVQTNRDGWMIDDIHLSGFSSWCSGIDEIEKNGLKLFPNPVTNKLFIQHKKDRVKPIIQIFDLTGREIIEDKNFKGSINTQSLPNGIYLLKYSESDNYALKKFIVEH